ncbi:unnamed protein product [Polarella glacialis]|uniref:Uncharacterized protein n=1 Tax=Polarella glacialis TaxID=89957 RepID=A0A813GPT4_POLGL|nr:unnamed protein product [Polarella glacialis]
MCGLIFAVAGDEALAFERHRQRIAAVGGISAATAQLLAELYPDAARFCQALLSNPSAPEPVGRAMSMAKQGSRAAARRLVAAFLDGDALGWDDLVDRAATVKGLTRDSASSLVSSFKGSTDKLQEALQQDVASQETHGPRTGLRRPQAEQLLQLLVETKQKDKKNNNTQTNNNNINKYCY